MHIRTFHNHIRSSDEGHWWIRCQHVSLWAFLEALVSEDASTHDEDISAGYEASRRKYTCVYDNVHVCIRASRHSLDVIETVCVWSVHATRIEAVTTSSKLLQHIWSWIYDRVFWTASHYVKYLIEYAKHFNVLKHYEFENIIVRDNYVDIPLKTPNFKFV